MAYFKTTLNFMGSLPGRRYALYECNSLVENVPFISQQKNDVSQAVAKYDQFDFLIDIVPRDEIKPAKRVSNINVNTILTQMTSLFYCIVLFSSRCCAII